MSTRALAIATSGLAIAAQSLAIATSTEEMAARVQEMSDSVGEMSALGREIETSTKAIATRRIAIATLDQEIGNLLCRRWVLRATPSSDQISPESPRRVNREEAKKRRREKPGGHSATEGHLALSATSAKRNQT
jgi:hypothetical protein